MIKIKEAVIVEGKYDKIKLSSIIDAPIIQTNGFRIFKDREKLNLISRVAETRGILILTDSDSAGFVIRNFLKGTVAPDLIKQAYIPPVKGKEKRKEQFSKECLLGVEGLDEQILLSAIRRSGATVIGDEPKKTAVGEITKQDLYEFGLSGGRNSARLRGELLKSLNMPEYLTTNAMLEMLNCLFTKEELIQILNKSL